MGESINGWRISKVKGIYVYDYWIVKNGKTQGRAIKDKKEWTAFEEKSGKLLFHEYGCEVTGKTLDGLVMSCADAEVSIKANMKNREEQRKT